MLRIFRGETGGEASPVRGSRIPTDAPARALEKLRGYHELAKDALAMAIEKDKAGQPQEAVKLYRKGLEIIYEGLALAVPNPGLDPAHSNVSKWRSEMNGWQQQVLDRLQDLEARGGSISQRGEALKSHPIPSLEPRKGSGGSPAARAASLSAAAVAGMPPSQAQQQRRVQSAGAGSQPNGTLRPAAARPEAAGAGAGSKEDQAYDVKILSEVLDSKPSVTWDDVAGLPAAKLALHEMVILPTLRADLFQGLRAPARGLLLYGPPGNGKTMLAKALAHEAKATFFNISAASLTSKWVGEAEKMVRALFRVASRMQPAIIFIDEIDSVLSERSSTEHEASRRLKTEFLVQFDGVAGGSDRVVVLAATNRPWDLDDAVRRRLPKRVYVALPDAEGRKAIIQHLLKGQAHQLGGRDLQRIVASTDGYSGSDLVALCKEAAMIPLRELGPAITTVSADKVRPVKLSDFGAALAAIKPSVGREQLRRFEEWTEEYGAPS